MIHILQTSDIICSQSVSTEHLQSSCQDTFPDVPHRTRILCNSMMISICLYFHTCTCAYFTPKQFPHFKSLFVYLVVSQGYLLLNHPISCRVKPLKNKTQYGKENMKDKNTSSLTLWEKNIDTELKDLGSFEPHIYKLYCNLYFL